MPSNILVLVRYNVISETVTEKYQLVWEGNIYAITGVTTDERKTSRTIIARKIK